jgi:hypothetical protein
MPPPNVQLEDDARKFVDTAKNGQINDALTNVRTAALNMQQTLYACGELPSDIRKRVLSASTTGLDDRLRFALTVAENLEIPADTFAGVSHSSPDDYLEARMFILVQLDKHPPKKRTIRTFYPEYKGSARDRLIAAAQAHANLGPHDLKQVVFFSLGGLYSWNAAEISTATKTTCGLFIRACLVAAGYRGRRDHWPVQCSGIFDYIDIFSLGHQAVKAVKRGEAVSFSAGDIFHIQFQGNDDHVGLMTKPVYDLDEDKYTSMDSVEGGQDPGGVHTKGFTGKLIYYKDGYCYFGQPVPNDKPLRNIIKVEGYGIDQHP